MIGWSLDPWQGQKRVHHEGELPDFRADFERFVVFGLTPPVTAVELLIHIAQHKGSEAVIVKYSAWKTTGFSSYSHDENTLIDLGYYFLAVRQTHAAVEAFTLEVRDYPKFWNSYDSLAEAYMDAGQRQLAIDNYQKSIELRPDNLNGIDMLKKLKDKNSWQILPPC
jgi:tetratricopeptide (TPR) repeat protein